MNQDTNENNNQPSPQDQADSKQTGAFQNIASKINPTNVSTETMKVASTLSAVSSIINTIKSLFK